MNHHLAIDIGASSMRAILGWLEDGKLCTEEVWRQPNGMETRNGHLCWNLTALHEGILSALKSCAASGRIPATLGIDTWGVDYVLLNKEGTVLGDSVAYRDSRTDGYDRKLEQVLPFSRHFDISGTAKQPFNTVYQLMAQFDENPSHREEAETFLMVPDYLGYLLTGVMKCEYTNASTTGLLNARTGSWSDEILTAALIPARLFQEPPAKPGTVLGNLKPSLKEELGFDVTVLLPATHDTGSAYLAVPKENEDTVTLSSGTWSLLGTELDAPVTDERALSCGFTNEGGYNGTIRFLKNIMGLWMLQCIRRESSDAFSFAQMAELAASAASYPGRVDVTDNRFLSPADMTAEVRSALAENGFSEPTFPELLSCVTHSLADSYGAAVRDLEQMLGRRFTGINVVGGGCQNEVLNAWTAEAAQLPVFAGPTEGTALGNLMAQMIAVGEFSGVQEARHILRKSSEVGVWMPTAAPETDR